MLQIRDLKYSLADRNLLNGVNWTINPGRRSALIGPNGAGKTTLLKILNGELEYQSGAIQKPKEYTIGYLPQEELALGKGSILEIALQGRKELVDIEYKLFQMRQQIEIEHENQELLAQFGELEHRFESLDGYRMESNAKAILSGLGFLEKDFFRPLSEFSGGWRMRAYLARLLLQEPNLLLLDEPTNHLDLPSLEWLEQYLINFPGSIVSVSHDRYFVDRLCQDIYELDNGRLEYYAGNYHFYENLKVEKRELLLKQYEEQKGEIEKQERFINRFRYKNTKAVQVQSRIKQLEKMETIEAPTTAPNLSKIRLADPPHSGHEIIRLEQAGFSYDQKRWIFKGLDLRISRGEKVALVGYNGMGKTTLLRMLAGQLEPIEGRRVLGHKVVVGYQSQDFAETMPPVKSVYHIVKQGNPAASEAQVRSLLGGFGFGGDAVEKKCEVLSGGEKIRLAFARLFIDPPNFLLLDEPTTHLDINGREALEAALKDYKGALCVVSHDVTFVRNIAEHIVAIDDSGVSRFPGGYDYFLQKQEERGGEPGNGRAWAGGTTSVSSTETARPAEKGKDARKARAQQREAEKALKKIEHQLEKLNQEQTALTGEMMSRRDADFAAINTRLAGIQREIRELETEWEQTAEALES